MNGFSITVVQHNPIDCSTIEEFNQNIKISCDWIDRAVAQYPSTDMVVFCEFGIGGANPSPNYDVPVVMPTDRLDVLLEKCKEKHIWACFNFQEREGDDFYNTSLIVNSEGEIALKYRKVNTFVPLEQNCAGDELPVCTGPKGSVLGMMICYDGDYPEVARELATKGANVIIRMTGYMEPYSYPWQFTTKARAYENTAYVVSCNRAGTTDLVWFGRSEVCDFDGKTILQAPELEEWMGNVVVYPELAEEKRSEKRIFNHLYNMKHRGYTESNLEGNTKNPYNFYKNWD